MKFIKKALNILKYKNYQDYLDFFKIYDFLGVPDFETWRTLHSSTILIQDVLYAASHIYPMLTVDSQAKISRRTLEAFGINLNLWENLYNENKGE